MIAAVSCSSSFLDLNKTFNSYIYLYYLLQKSVKSEKVFIALFTFAMCTGHTTYDVRTCVEAFFFFSTKYII